MSGFDGESQMLPVSFKRRWASILSTAGIILSSMGVQAQPRCAADLARVQKEFCISEQHRDGAVKLNYNWQLNDDAFEVKTKLCFGGSQQPDLILAIDRSESLRLADKPRKKLGSDSISVAIQLIEDLKSQVNNSTIGPKKVGVVLFAGDSECREYQGGPIGINADFPCLYVPAHSLSETSHVDKLVSLLNAADGQYALGDRPAAGKYGIVTQLIQDQRLNLTPEALTGLVLFSDGRTYQSALPYPYLRMQSFTDGQGEAKSDFANPELARVKLIFAHSSAPVPLYDNINFGVSYENMCDPSVVPLASEMDCRGQVSIDNPLTWPTNQLDTKTYANDLAKLLGGFDVVSLTTKSDLDFALARLSNTVSPNVKIDSATLRINNDETRQIDPQGESLSLGVFASNKPINLDLDVRVDGNQIRVPITINTTRITDNTSSEFENAEMYCTASLSPASERYKMQGGAASCGHVGIDSKTKKPPVSRTGVYIVLLVPILIAIFVSGKSDLNRFFHFLIILFPLIFSFSSHAKSAEKNGVNVLNFRPVVDGVGQVDKADVLSFGTANAGIFIDYSNDVVELSGEDNKRIKSVMDNLVTGHFVFNLGILPHSTLGVHLPYVHRTDLSREVDGKKIDAGQIGMPADSAAYLKVNLLNKNTVNLALMPMATLPVGRSQMLIGDGVPKYGALGIVSGGATAFQWSLSSGYMQRQKSQVFADERAYAVVLRGQGFFTIGGEYRIEENINFGASVQIKPSAGEGLKIGRSSPAEWMMVAKIKSALGIETSGGVGTGIGTGIGAPDYRVWAGLSWIPSAPTNNSRAKSAVNNHKRFQNRGDRK